jgi:multidrug efflux pump subunit AcrA (membrane-fusion protein)
MNDKSSLLDSLKIERAPVRKRPSGPSPVLLGAAGVAVVAIAAAAWFFWPDNRVPVHVITAAAGGGAGGGTSLDASGYVVARRKATLSAKILGKVTEVNFEEGQKVKVGDIVARLDDSNYEAALRLRGGAAPGRSPGPPGQGDARQYRADLHALPAPQEPGRHLHRCGGEPALDL